MPTDFLTLIAFALVLTLVLVASVGSLLLAKPSGRLVSFCQRTPSARRLLYRLIIVLGASGGILLGVGAALLLWEAATLQPPANLSNSALTAYPVVVLGLILLVEKSSLKRVVLAAG